MIGKKEAFYKNPMWSFVGVVLMVIFEIAEKMMTENMNSIIEFLPSMIAILLAFYGFYLLFEQKKEIKKDKMALNTLKDIASNKKDDEYAKWNYGKHEYNIITLNDTWEQEIKGLLKTTDRPDLDYYNFGEEFYFFDLSTGKSIEIPTGNKARNEKPGNSIRVGMVLRLMPKVL